MPKKATSNTWDCMSTSSTTRPPVRSSASTSIRILRGSLRPLTRRSKFPKADPRMFSTGAALSRWSPRWTRPISEARNWWTHRSCMVTKKAQKITGPWRTREMTKTLQVHNRTTNRVWRWSKKTRSTKLFQRNSRKPRCRATRRSPSTKAWTRGIASSPTSSTRRTKRSRTRSLWKARNEQKKRKSTSFRTFNNIIC